MSDGAESAGIKSHAQMLQPGRGGITARLGAGGGAAVLLRTLHAKRTPGHQDARGKAACRAQLRHAGATARCRGARSTGEVAGGGSHTGPTAERAFPG